MYGKQTETAIAALSRLAEVWDGGSTRLSAAEIADQRGLPRAMVAKILSALSQAGLVSGSPGPGGGYALSRPPHQMRLREPYDIFEREDVSNNCPFGGGVCGVGEPCAMHDRLKAMQAAIRKLLEDTTFEIFRVSVQEEGLIPVAKGVRPELPRDTYRAAHPRRKRA
jgi:Rrf2 family protein